MQGFPSEPGTYALVLDCSASRALTIGRLGALTLRAGWAIYTGSAFGPGGLRARIEHHLRPVTRPHWHIDYLRRRARVSGVWHAAGLRLEHEWAQRTASLEGAEPLLSGFGSSDCDCPAHGFWFVRRPAPDALRVALAGGAVYREV